MPEVLTPENEAQTTDAVQWALSTETPVEVRSRGTKSAVGAPVSLPNRIDLHRICGVKLYEPDELVLRLGPGTPLNELEELLAKHNQLLPFEPPRLHGVSGTIGGIVGTNLAGPRRFKAGAVRDYVIGIRGVSGFGEAFQSGGRVVKNVSGYDLSKLMTGSFGTLAALTEITLKVLPKAESETTVLFRALTPAEAAPIMREVAGSTLEPSAIAHLPEQIVANAQAIDAGSSATVIRLEGPAVSLNERAAALQTFAKSEAQRLDPDTSAALWREIRDVTLIPSTGALWRVTVPPTTALEAIAENDPNDWFIDWAGGLVWMRFDNPQHVPRLKAGSAMRVRCDAAAAHFPAFTPADEGVAGLSRRLKNSFDPKVLLNPGRMGGHSA